VHLNLPSEQRLLPGERRRHQLSVLPSKLPGSQLKYQAPEEERREEFITRFNLKLCSSSQSG